MAQNTSRDDATRFHSTIKKKTTMFKKNWELSQTY